MTSGAAHVNCGGPALGSFVPDTDFSGGATLVRNVTIDLTGVVNPPPMAVYQTQRYNNMTYTFPGFAAGSKNDIRLHFADTKWTTANQRLFNVTINGALVLSNFDVIGTAGAPNKAVAETVTLPADSSGKYTIQFVGTKDATMVSGIEITPTASGACDASPLSNTGWVASASLTSGSNTPAKAIDSSSTTRWTTGVAQASGQYFQLDLGGPQTFSRLVMNAGSSGGEYAHKYNVFVSNDGTSFGTAVASGTGVKQIETVDFAPQTARYVRVVLAGSASTEWSIYDIGVSTSGCANSGATTGSLTISGTLKDAAGKPIVGGRINLSGAAQAVRFSDFAGNYVFHVAAGTYSLSAAAECTLSPSTVTFTNMTANKTQAFTATTATCATSVPSNVGASGEQLTLVKNGVKLATTYARVEPRTDANDAAARLTEIGAEQPGAISISVAGNPAVERQTTIHLGSAAGDHEGDDDGETSDFTVVTLAVAVGSSVVRFESQAPDDVSADTLQRLLSAGRNFQPEGAANLHGPTPAPVATTSFPQAKRLPAASPTATAFARGTFGELQIAASDVANAVVYGRQSGPFVSNDGGKTVTASTLNTVPAPPATVFVSAGDPSVVVGAPSSTGTQAFYYAQIEQSQAQAAGPPAVPQLLADAVYSSTDNGATFNLVSFPVNCAAAGQTCTVPDQEMLAADRVNRAVTTTGSADQVYMSWRNFTPFGNTPGVACSKDGGATWTIDLTTLATSGGDNPRVTVGPDGSLVVLYAKYNPNGLTYSLNLQKFSSCASGFKPAKLVTVNATVTEVTPMPGPDRPPVANYVAAFDDTDTTGQRLFVAYSNEISAGNDDIVVQESLDGGVTFSSFRSSPINTVHTGRRFFPAMCATQGVAHVSWYDRRNSTAASPDLTAYYRSSVNYDPTKLSFNIGAEINVSGVDDPECSSGFPNGVRQSVEETACGADLPAAFVQGGTCQSTCPMGATPPCGTLTPCDFRVPNSCPTPPAPDGGVDGGADGGADASLPLPETCTPISGVPKYGDYNGNGCAGGVVYMAWASSTPPPSATCQELGYACAVGATCCSGNCVNNTCAPTPAACTPNGGACGAGQPACCSVNGNGRCQGGVCEAAVSVYTGSSGVAPRFITANTDLTQANSEVTHWCGTGKNFTPNATVHFQIEYGGQGTDNLRTNVGHVTADASGNFSYAFDLNLFDMACPAQFPNIRWTAIEETTGTPFVQVIVQACQKNGTTCP
ncbi:MAG TPA: discoidin domain-containing protein [Polyangia bacterium]|nr:discoidin domain-containing protein [Polyangia bacterium]